MAHSGAEALRNILRRRWWYLQEAHLQHSWGIPARVRRLNGYNSVRILMIQARVLSGDWQICTVSGTGSSAGEPQAAGDA